MALWCTKKKKKSRLKHTKEEVESETADIKWGRAGWSERHIVEAGKGVGRYVWV